MVKNTFLFLLMSTHLIEISDIKASLSVRGISNQKFSDKKQFWKLKNSWNFQFSLQCFHPLNLLRFQRWVIGRRWKNKWRKICLRPLEVTWFPWENTRKFSHGTTWSGRKIRKSTRRKTLVFHASGIFTEETDFNSEKKRAWSSD